MEHYGIIGWIVIGGIAGAIAKLLMPGKTGRLHHHRHPRHCRRACRRLARPRHRLVWSDEGAGFIAAIVGAFILLAIYRLVAGRR